MATVAEFLKFLRIKIGKKDENDFKDVAEALFISEAEAKDYENGILRMPTSMYYGLAALYKMPCDIFKMKTIDSADYAQRTSVVLNAPERATFPLGEYEYILTAYYNNMAALYELDGSDNNFKLKHYQQAIKSLDDAAAFFHIAQAAKEMRVELGVDEIAPFDIFDITEQHKMEIIYTDLPFQEGTGFRVNGLSYFVGEMDKTFMFFINKLDSATKQRFSIAHELGHSKLHAGIKFKDCTDDEIAQLDEVAQCFANMLILPPDAAKMEYDKLESVEDFDKIQTIANKYYTSVKTVYYAFFNHPAIDFDAKQLEKLCKAYNKIKDHLTLEAGRTDNTAYNRRIDNALRSGLISYHKADDMKGYVDEFQFFRS